MTVWVLLFFLSNHPVTIETGSFAECKRVAEVIKKQGYWRLQETCIEVRK